MPVSQSNPNENMDQKYNEACVRLEPHIRALKQINAKVSEEMNAHIQSRSFHCGECLGRAVEPYVHKKSQLNSLLFNISKLKKLADEPIHDRIAAINATADLFEGKMALVEYLALSDNIHGKPNRPMQAVGVVLLILEFGLYGLFFECTATLVLPLLPAILCAISAVVIPFAVMSLTFIFLIEENGPRGVSSEVLNLGSVIERVGYGAGLDRYPQFFNQQPERGDRPVEAIVYGEPVRMV